MFLIGLIKTNERIYSEKQLQTDVRCCPRASSIKEGGNQLTPVHLRASKATCDHLGVVIHEALAGEECAGAEAESTAVFQLWWVDPI